MKKIYIVGIGMGNNKTITGEGQSCLLEAEVYIGAKRMLAGYRDLEKPVVPLIRSQEIADFIQECSYETIAVLMSGDVGFYSGANQLLPKLKGYDVKLIPGISSLSYFCARLGISWEQVYPVSVHGRTQNLIPAVQSHFKTFALTEGNIHDICMKLIEAELGYVEVYVGENLSYPHERIVHGIPAELLGMEFKPLSTVLIVNEQYKTSTKIGLADDSFLRGKVPMTKSEVRAVILSKLKLRNDSVAYDIGAGTGSVSIEMALNAPFGTVYAIEQKAEAFSLIEANKKKFCTENLFAIEGMAPEAILPLPTPDTVFIGGSKGKMGEIFEVLLEKCQETRVVISAIALETLSEVVDLAKKYALDELEIVQVSVAKAEEVGAYHMMKAQNPVFIISGILRRKDELDDGVAEPK